VPNRFDERTSASLLAGRLSKSYFPATALPRSATARMLLNMLSQNPARSFRPWRWIAWAPRRAGRSLITIYRYAFSPLIGFHCRHLPTCSEYADTALGRFGLWAGGWMTLARLCRCHPLGTSGLDFVPTSLPRRARWYFPWRYGRWRGPVSSVPEAGAEPH